MVTRSNPLLGNLDGLMVSSISRRRVLVTGSAGFIGRPLTTRLTACGYQVLGYDLVDGDDVLDAPKLADALRKVDAVVHLAAPSSVQMFNERPEASRHIALQGLRNLLTQFSKRVVFPSSSAAYGDSLVPCSEDARLPVSNTFYALTKVAAERLCRHFNARGGDAKIARLFPCYGPGEVSKGAYASTLFHLTSNAVYGRDIVLFGDGRQRRDFLHVEDAVTGIVKLLETESRHSVFNLGTGHGTTLLDVVTQLRRLTRSAPNIIHRRAPPGYVRNCVADPTLARGELGLQPVVAVESGLERLADELSRRPK